MMTLQPQHQPARVLLVELHTSYGFGYKFQVDRRDAAGQ